MSTVDRLNGLGLSPDPRQMQSIFAEPVRYGVGQRLLALILIFSSLVTVVTTGVQLFFDYNRDLSTIDTRLTEIKHGYLDSLAGSLWHVDRAQLRLQLEGIARLPSLHAVEVRETTEGVEQPLVIRVENQASNTLMVREYPITFDERGIHRTIGTLKLEATLDDVYGRLLEKTVVILISQGIKTFLVSLFIIYIVHRLVTRHLIAISLYLGKYDIRNPLPPLRLMRRKPKHEDELEQMASAFNAMCWSLQEAYHEVQETNAALAADIVLRRRAEDEVRRLNEGLEETIRLRTMDLEAANRELSAFTYSVSHDLRAPLRRIEGFGQLIEEESAAGLSEQGRHYLMRMRAGVREMGEMTESFLKLSQASRAELTLETVDLSAMAQEVATTCRENTPRHPMEVLIAPGMEVRGDRHFLRIALANLFNNAWKYTHGVAAPQLEFGTEKHNGQMVYFVKDNGVGFEQSRSERMFIPFHRLHSAQQFEGLGIGLATVQRIIARHGGRIWAEGKVGAGAKFYFTLWDNGLV
jgi:signal transduction histidine kinase